MKLLRLKLGEKFRSLQAGFELHFLREWDHSEVSDLTAFEFAPYVLSQQFRAYSPSLQINKLQK